MMEHAIVTVIGHLSVVIGTLLSLHLNAGAFQEGGGRGQRRVHVAGAEPAHIVLNDDG